MIPSWNMAGVLPPIRPGALGHDSDRSPYITTLGDVVDRFALTSDRVKILLGLLQYRNALHQLGVVSGFQWLDGSFVEDVETLESRPPKDIDVVTYLELPSGHTQATLWAAAGGLFKNAYVKKTYFVDAYPQVLGGSLSAHSIKQVSYWYSMWSHRRNGTWKGFVQVDLNPAEDAAAACTLSAAITGGGTP